eukprot:SAG31_NODE_31317_length_369_cov_1.148148_1_plen_45_part_01
MPIVPLIEGFRWLNTRGGLLGCRLVQVELDVFRQYEGWGSLLIWM